jgi:fructose-bisphosphate aldolase class 1
MSRKRTALEYLIEEYAKHCDGDGLIPFEIIEIAKDMEKEEIMKAYAVGKLEITMLSKALNTGEQYYNETYGKQ